MTLGRGWPRQHGWLLLAGGLLLAGRGMPAELGEPAPPLLAAQWLKGGPLDLGAGRGNTVYVIGFWAASSPLCRPSITHLAELQATYPQGGLACVGITEEPPAQVQPLIEPLGTNLNYAVAVDDHHQTAKAYLGGFGVIGLPHAFVVDKTGAVVWHGHPMLGLDDIVAQVVAGKLDRGAARKSARAGTLAQQYLRLVRTGDAGPAAAQLGSDVVRDGTNNTPLLNEFAWAILTDTHITNRDLPLALRAAQAARDVTGGREPAILDTYARALFDSGRIPEAIAAQEGAVKACNDPRVRAQLEATLRHYRERLPAK